MWIERLIQMAIAAALLGPLGTVNAATIVNLISTINGGQANAGAGTGSPGTGSATMTLDLDTNLFSWSVSWQGLSGVATAAHFHGPALPGVNAGVQVGIDHTTNPATNSATLTSSQSADLLAGLWYMNIHSVLNPGGEIRGQVFVDTDDDGDPDVTDPDDDNDGIRDELDRQPLVASNNCTTNDGANATLVSEQVMDEQTCASKESVDVNGNNGALNTVVFGLSGDLRLISEKVIFKDTRIEVGGRLEVINADPCSGCPTYYAIGHTGPAGGIIFYVTDGGLHGLEAAPVDQSIDAEWGCYNTGLPGADGLLVETGELNTTDILVGCAERPIAASVADSYSGPGEDTSGWFLPSRDELDLMYKNLHKHVPRLGNFAIERYWSSSEFDPKYAWSQQFANAGSTNPTTTTKTSNYHVRAVRAF